MIKKVGIIISILLIFVGISGFFGGFLISIGALNYEYELPLSDIQGIVVDDKEYIYIGLGFYGKVQVYDKNGVFIRNWKVNAYNGSFHIELTKDQNILISTAREDNQILYNQYGKEISREKINNIYSLTKRPWDSFISEKGKAYEVKGRFPKTIRTLPDEQIIINQPFLLQLMSEVFFSWFMIIIGFFFYFILRKEKFIEMTDKYITF